MVHRHEGLSGRNYRATAARRVGKTKARRGESQHVARISMPFSQVLREGATHAWAALWVLSDTRRDQGLARPCALSCRARTGGGRGWHAAISRGVASPT